MGKRVLNSFICFFFGVPKHTVNIICTRFCGIFEILKSHKIPEKRTHIEIVQVQQQNSAASINLCVVISFAIFIFNVDISVFFPHLFRIVSLLFYILFFLLLLALQKHRNEHT